MIFGHSMSTALTSPRLACGLTPTDERGVLFERRLDLGRYLSEAGDPARAMEILRGVAGEIRQAVRASDILA